MVKFTADDRADLRRALSLAIEVRAGSLVNLQAWRARRARHGAPFLVSLDAAVEAATADVDRFSELLDRLGAPE